MPDEYERDQYGVVLVDPQGYAVKKKKKDEADDDGPSGPPGPPNIRSLEDQALYEAAQEVDTRAAGRPTGGAAERDRAVQMNASDRLRKLEQGSTFDMDFDTKQASRALLGFNPSSYGSREG